MYLYPKDQTDFTWNGQVLVHAYDAVVEREKSFELSFRHLLDSQEFYKSLKEGMLVKAHTPDGEQPFRIWEITKHDTYIEVDALHVMYDLDTKMTNPIHINDGQVSDALRQLETGMASERGPFTFSSSITKKRTYNTEDPDKEKDKYNALDELLKGAHSIVGTWEAELLLNGWDIRLVDSVGRVTDALLYEKKNISKYEDETSNASLCTRIYAESTFRPERKEGEEKEPEEVHLSVIVESPLINEYEQVYERHYVNNNLKTEKELSDWASRKFKYEKIDLPRRSIKIDTNIIDGTEINYGDTLVLKYFLHDVEEVIRCVGYKYDPIGKEYIQLMLGSTPQTVGGQIKSSIADLTNEQIGNLVAKEAERVTNIIMSSNGSNRIAYGPDPVPNPTDNDLWYYFEFDTPNDVMVKYWDDELKQWRILVDDFTGRRVKEQIGKIDKKVESQTQAITDSEKKADQAVSEATGAKTLAERAQQITAEIQALTSEQDEAIKRLTERETIRDELEAEFISNEAQIRYNENRWDGEPDGYLPAGQGCIPVKHNGDGFIIGKEYTVSIVLYPREESEVKPASLYIGAFVETRVEQEVR